jgi:hypothetical protein
MFPDWKIDPAFFEPLSDEELAEWYGGELPAPISPKSRRRRTRR